MTLILRIPVDERYERLRARLALSLNHLSSAAQRDKWNDAQEFLARCRREIVEMRVFEKEYVVVGDPQDIDTLTHFLSRVDLMLDTVERHIQVRGEKVVRDAAGFGIDRCRDVKQAAYRVEMHALPSSVEDL